jgi:hypothetical protein
MVVKTSCAFFSPMNGSCKMHVTTKMNLIMFVDAINNIKLDLTLIPMKCGKKVKQDDLIQFLLLHNYLALWMQMKMDIKNSIF